MRAFRAWATTWRCEPKLFDAIYTGTETRDANCGQRLQSYQSYLQTAYFNRIKPGGNQGGWIDGGGDARYAEQFWDTFFAKVPEIMLFNSQQIMRGLGGGRGGRGGGAGEPDTNSILANLMAPMPQADGTSYTPNMVARTAGYSAEILDRFLGKLGRPIGVATYKPCNSAGEAYLPDYLGMVGVPIDLAPEFPGNAATILLTAASRYDPDLVARTKEFVRKGGQAIATTGLIEALGERGFQDIAEIEVTGRRVLATRFGGGRGGFGGGGRGGEAAGAAQADLNLLLPQMRHFENDSWTAINFETADSGYPLVLRAAYGKGTFYALAVPDDFGDIYRLPQSVLTQIRNLLGRDLFVSLDAPDHVSLFPYDNRTFIVQNFRAQAVTARVSVARATALRDLLSGQTVAAAPEGEAVLGAGAAGAEPGSAAASRATAAPCSRSRCPLIPFARSPPTITNNQFSMTNSQSSCPKWRGTASPARFTPIISDFWVARPTRSSPSATRRRNPLFTPDHLSGESASASLMTRSRFTEKSELRRRLQHGLTWVGNVV